MHLQVNMKVLQKEHETRSARSASEQHYYCCKTSQNAFNKLLFELKSLYVGYYFISEYIILCWTWNTQMPCSSHAVTCSVK